MYRWNGRVALVTGASAGIGAEICRELVKYNMTVVGCARRAQKIRDIAEEDEIKAAPGRLVAVQCDLTKESDILAMFEEIRNRFGRIDVCVNNAGVSSMTNLTEGKTEDWREIFEIFILAMCICTRESIKLMKEKGIDDGQIIQIGGAVKQETRSQIAYRSALKLMVRDLAEGQRRELTGQKSHIRVACIALGVVKGTEMLEKIAEEYPDMKTESYIDFQALSTKDVAEVIVHILMLPPHVDVSDIILRSVEDIC